MTEKTYEQKLANIQGEFNAKLQVLEDMHYSLTECVKLATEQIRLEREYLEGLQRKYSGQSSPTSL